MKSHVYTWRKVISGSKEAAGAVCACPGAICVSVCWEEAGGREQGHFVSRTGRRMYDIVTPSDHLDSNGFGSIKGC